MSAFGLTAEQNRAFFVERELGLGGESARSIVDKVTSQFANLNLAACLPGWDPIFYFRGQRDDSWGFTSSLARLSKRRKPEPLSESALARQERRMLTEARRDVADGSPATWLGRNMSDGELLMVLQHHGCPTRFIDVTEDPLVALYFAVENEDTIDGRLFAVGLRGIDMAAARTSGLPQGTLLEMPVGDQAPLPWPTEAFRRTSHSDWTNSVFVVAPLELDPRMRAQRGRLLVGGLNRAYPTGNIYTSVTGEFHALSASERLSVSSILINFRKTAQKQAPGAGFDAYGWSFRIPCSTKPQIRAILRRDYGICRDSLFPAYEEFRRLAMYVART